eukprot:scaffold21210_cov53-Attheya_sp.AAC.7
MAIPEVNNGSDLDKLWLALSSLTSIQTLDDILEAFGLKDMPAAQRYGIMFGCMTFTFTITAVVSLLFLGGTFKRIQEQSETGTATIPDAITARVDRPLLLERLLEARERLMKNDASPPTQEGLTNLTKTILNVGPRVEVVNESGKSKTSSKKQEVRRHIPPGYEANYLTAYRKCQDKPGGKTLSGLPEARYEAYARSYAGCGVNTSLSYRRSYARMYETLACNTHATEKKMSDHFTNRPEDIVGRMVRLEALEVDRHLQAIYDSTCGEAHLENKSFNPMEVWGFLDCGPFANPKELQNSWVFQRKHNEASFAIVESITDRPIGVIILTNDDPKNLTVSLELPIVKPTSDGTAEQIEACFLVMDKLFALGYRRIQLALDAHDASGKKMPARIGFTQEGMIPKHMIVKESNRDSNIYGMLNSDWDAGARSFLFKKLHGAAAQK